MPYRTDHGRCYHETYGCHGATTICGTDGLAPCSVCCAGGKAGTGGDGAKAASSAGGGAATASAPGGVPARRGMGPEEDVTIAMPEGAQAVSGALSEAGFPCHAVGGCVRDALLGVTPHDWDMTTPATVGEMHAAFEAAGLRVYDTGAKHGTVTVVDDDGEGYEVTTYRIDGEYSDGRHPDSVTFTDDITEDLARRDFTINAMAWSADGGMVDPFGGRDDLAAGLIRCVGDPCDRFSEDPLRIMRATRFAARLGFSIEDGTAAAMREMAPRLSAVSGERRQKELLGMLGTDDTDGLAGILRSHPEVVFAAVPSLASLSVTPQSHPYHRFGNVWDHTVEVVANTPNDPVVRLAALLHDCGKPACLEIRADGRTSFHNHPCESARVAREALDDLRVDSKTRDEVLRLVANHDLRLRPRAKDVRKAFVRFRSWESFKRWWHLRRADVLGQSEYAQSVELPNLDAVMGLARELAETEGIFSISDMRLRGADLIEMGMHPGPEMGEVLKEAFRHVLGGGIANEREALLRFAQGAVARSEHGSR